MHRIRGEPLAIGLMFQLFPERFGLQAQFALAIAEIAETLDMSCDLKAQFAIGLPKSRRSFGKVRPDVFLGR